MKKMKKLLLLITLIAGVIAFALPAQAKILDLTAAGNIGDINSAWFYTSLNSMIVGTGVFDPFLQLQGPASGTNDEKGYNTDGTQQFDTASGPWTHSLQLQTLVDYNNIYTKDGTDYYEFVLDINEPGGRKSLLTLHELQFYIHDDPNMTNYASWSINPAMFKVYDLDTGGDSQIDLDADLTSGSGKGCDMVALIPTAVFGTDYSKYLYLFAAFGNPDLAEDGFEEFAHFYGEGTFTGGGDPIPEPATMLLLGSGLIGLAVSGKKRLKKRNG